MGFVYCATCRGDQHVCAICTRTWRYERRSNHTIKRSKGGCGATIKHHRVPCPAHVEAKAECDFCGFMEAAPKTIWGEPGIPNHWATPDVGPRKHGLACPGCWTRLSVVLDSLWASGFDDVFARHESMACAFAFQIGLFSPHRQNFGEALERRPHEQEGIAMKRLLGWSPIVGIIGLAVMGILSERKAEKWREVAYEGVEVATECRARLKEQIADCAEDINERSKWSNELAAYYCAEKVTGCTGTNFRGLMRNSAGVYTCRCGEPR